jgi:hypothetical protein
VSAGQTEPHFFFLSSLASMRARVASGQKARTPDAPSKEIRFWENNPRREKNSLICGQQIRTAVSFS